MLPMRSLPSVVLLPGVGIEGDRYSTGKGTYEAFPEPGRQLTVISGDSAEASMCGLRNAPSATAAGVGAMRRNVVVSGITAAALNAAVGCTLRLGPCTAGPYTSHFYQLNLSTLQITRLQG